MDLLHPSFTPSPLGLSSSFRSFALRVLEFHCLAGHPLSLLPYPYQWSRCFVHSPIHCRSHCFAFAPEPPLSVGFTISFPAPRKLGFTISFPAPDWTRGKRQREWIEEENERRRNQRMKEREFTVKERRETPLLFMSYQSLLHRHLYNLPWFPEVKVAPSLLNLHLLIHETELLSLPLSVKLLIHWLSFPDWFHCKLIHLSVSQFHCLPLNEPIWPYPIYLMNERG